MPAGIRYKNNPNYVLRDGHYHRAGKIESESIVSLLAAADDYPDLPAVQPTLPRDFLASQAHLFEDDLDEADAGILRPDPSNTRATARFNALRDATRLKRAQAASQSGGPDEQAALRAAEQKSAATAAALKSLEANSPAPAGGTSILSSVLASVDRPGTSWRDVGQAAPAKPRGFLARLFRR